MNPTITRILHPTDFDAGSSRALALAVHLAKQHAAELHVLHVEPSLSAEWKADRSHDDDSVRAHLQRWIGAAPPARVVTVARPGTIASGAILDYAAEAGIDLIVMGARRLHQGYGHLLGSVAREVTLGSECPVLTVRSEEVLPAPASLSSVLVPFDFSPAAGEALGAAAEIARRAKAKLVLLHVLPDSARGRLNLKHALRNMRLRALTQSRLKDAAATVAPGVEVSVLVRTGSPVDEIVSCAAELDSDLVVLRSHASAGRLMVSGSVAEEVQRFARSPVLLVKSPAAHAERESV